MCSPSALQDEDVAPVALGSHDLFICGRKVGPETPLFSWWHSNS